MSLTTILLILVVIFIGLPMVGTILMAMFGIAIWILKTLWGWFTDGFVGSSSSDMSSRGGGYSGELPDFLTTTVPAICSANNKGDVKGLNRIVNTTDPSALKLGALMCDQYSSYKNASYVKNACALANMYGSGIAGLLDTAATDDVGTEKDKEAVTSITTAFCGNQLTFTDNAKDSYWEIVKKFTSFETALKTWAPAIPTTYKYIVPEIPERPVVQMTVNSYKCNTFNVDEQNVLRALRGRTLDTPDGVKFTADAVEVNLCKAKGFESGKGNFKGCGGCAGLGCCEPSADPLPASAPLTEEGTITGAGIPAGTAGTTGTAGIAGTAKCPQPVVREYRLNRKPAKFRKVQAPSPDFLECFEGEGEGEPQDQQLGLREVLRAQKASKLFELAQRA